MKKISAIIVFVLCALALSAGCSGETRLSEEEEKEVRRAVNESFDGLVAASKSFDFDHYLEFFDEDKFTGLNANGTVTHSLDDFDDAYRESFSIPEAYQSLRFKNVKVTVIDRYTAILVNEFEAQVLLKSGEVIPASGGGAQTWSKASGAWKLVSVSSSAKDPVAAE